MGNTEEVVLHTYIHTYINTLTDFQSLKYTYIYTYMDTYIILYIRTYIYTYILYIHTCMHTYIHTYCTYTHRNVINVFLLLLQMYGSQFLWQSYPASPMVGAPSHSTYIHSPSNALSTASIFTATLPFRALASQDSYLSPQPSSSDISKLGYDNTNLTYIHYINIIPFNL